MKCPNCNNEFIIRYRSLYSDMNLRLENAHDAFRRHKYTPEQDKKAQRLAKRRILWTFLSCPVCDTIIDVIKDSEEER
jgi:hypothetical protein